MNSNNDKIEHLIQELKISYNLAYYLYNTKNGFRSENQAKQKYREIEKNIPKLQKEFDQYEINGIIQDDGCLRFFNDIDIYDEDVYAQLYIIYKCKALIPAKFTFNEFILGMTRMKCMSIRELKEKSKDIKKKIKEKNQYKKLYQYFFVVQTQGKSNYVKLDQTLDIWDWVLGKIFPLIHNFTQYCRAQPVEIRKTTKVSQDLWDQIWQYFEIVGNDVNKFDINAAWPVIIIEFAEFNFNRKFD